MNKIKAWLKSKNVTSHTIAVLALGAAGAVAKDQQVRDLLIKLFIHHPALVPDLVLLAGVVLRYSHSSSDAGKVAAAQVIEAKIQPPPPTQAEVDAANPTTTKET